jgi:long-chain acyl-CoA synthetase
VVEDQEQLDKVLAIRERLPHLVAIVVIDPKGLRRYDRNGMWDFEDIVRMGSDFEKEEPAQSEALLKGPQLDDIALMVFTSGSTGKPKAAMMSWRGLGCAAQGLNSMLGCTHQHSLVSYLPLCHVAEQMFSIHIPLYKGAVVNFAESLRTIQEDLRELSPQIFFGVPRIWEKFHSSIQSKIRESGRLQQWLFESAMSSLENIGQKSRSQWSLFESTVWWFWWRRYCLRSF